MKKDKDVNWIEEYRGKFLEYSGDILVSSIVTYLTSQIKIIHSLGYTGLLLIFAFTLSILFAISHKNIHRSWFRAILIFVNNHIQTNIHLKSVKGFFQRESIVKKIYQIHRDNSGVAIGIICGQGGSGKTDLAKNFEQVACNYCYSEYICDKNSTDLPEPSSFRSNTVVFIDYTYEYTRDSGGNQKLNLFIDKCKNSHKKISVWLLERTNLSGYIMKRFTNSSIEVKTINLNDREIDHERLLKEIFNYKLTDLVVEKDIIIADLINQIITKFDPVYKRPLFAIIMSELLLDNPNHDFNSYEGRNLLIEKYWQLIVKRKRFDERLLNLSDNDSEDINENDIILIRDNLIKRAESLILFLIMTDLKLVINDIDGRANRKLQLIFANKHEYNNKPLISYIQNELLVYPLNNPNEKNIPLPHLLLKLLFPFEDNGDTIYNENDTIVIDIEIYDIISAWLLSCYFGQGIQKDSYLIELFNYVGSDLINNILCFLTRSAEDDKGVALLWWENHYLTKEDVWKFDGDMDWINNCLEIYPKAPDNVKKAIENLLNSFLENFDTNGEEYKNLYTYFTNYSELNNELIDKLNLSKLKSNYRRKN